MMRAPTRSVEFLWEHLQVKDEIVDEFLSGSENPFRQPRRIKSSAGLMAVT